MSYFIDLFSGGGLFECFTRGGYESLAHNQMNKDLIIIVHLLLQNAYYDALEKWYVAVDS